MRHLFLKPEICFTSLVAQLCRLAVLSGEYFTPLDAILHQIFRFLAKAYIFFRTSVSKRNWNALIHSIVLFFFFKNKNYLKFKVASNF